MARTVRTADRKHLLDCGLRPDRLGPKCGTGAGHAVYRYGDTMVIKLPKIRWIKERLEIITYEDAQRSHEMTHRYFREYSLPSRVLRSASCSSYCILQQHVPEFENLTQEHLRSDARIAYQLRDILRRNNRMIRVEGVSLDFLGQEGCIQTALASVRRGVPQMSNLVVVGKGSDARIVIVDANVFRLRCKRGSALQSQIMRDAGRWGFALNRLIVQRAFVPILRAACGAATGR